MPGHGAPFSDVAGALHRARQRLAAFRADPARHARHGIKVLVKYHLMEEQQQSWPAFLDWFGNTPLCQAVWQQLGRPEGTPAHFAEQIVHELVRGGSSPLRCLRRPVQHRHPHRPPPSSPTLKGRPSLIAAWPGGTAPR
jgi:hypothetical protein